MVTHRRSLARPFSGVLLAAGALIVACVAPAATAQPSLPAEHVVPDHLASAAVLPPAPGLNDNPAPGLIFADLVHGSATGLCSGLLQLRTAAGAVCTHGPDPAPGARDVRLPRSTAELAAGTSTLASTVPCYGDGASGNRVQAIYVHAADVADRYPDIVGSIQQWAGNVDRAFSDSAAGTGGTRHVRWATDAACNVTVQRVQLSTVGDDSFSATTSELQALGFNRTDRKYLLWVDANVYCGIGGIQSDDRSTSDNANNRGPSYARIDSGCWGLSPSTEAHELMHNLGGVQLSAPHSSGGWHCTDKYDAMCYVDAAGVTMTYPCPIANDRLFDCNHDDYFHTAPPVGSYLSTHWNSASSSFLESGEAVTTTTLGPTTTTAPPTTTTTVPPTTTTTMAPSATSTFSSKLSKNVTTRSFAVSTGSGTLTTRLTFSGGSPVTVTVRSSTGTVVGQSSGGSPQSLSVSVLRGSYTVTVSGSGSVSFTLTVLYPSS